MFNVYIAPDTPAISWAYVAGPWPCALAATWRVGCIRIIIAGAGTACQWSRSGPTVQGFKGSC